MRAVSATGRVVLSLITVFGIFGASRAEAWGAKGHQIVAYVGADLSGEAFWASNDENMRTLSTVPDRLWKASATKQAEAPNHWFQADAYAPDINRCEDILKFPPKYSDAVAQYGNSVIEKNGTAPWRIEQMYDSAVKAFRAGDMETGVQLVGVMTHYIGDLSQPLHVSENYDGQQSGNSGIHSWFETQNIGDEMGIRKEVNTRASALLNNADFIRESSGTLSDLIDHEVIRSLEKRDEVLQNDTKFGRQSAQAKSVQLNLAEDRMADGAAVIAVVLQRLSKDSGLTSNSSRISVTDPDFIAPDFGFVSPRDLMTPAASNPAFDDDCGAY
jgi:hypothetical protein